MALIKITGLFLNEQKDGTKYMSGTAQDGVKYLVFKNKNKEGKQPDYNLFLDDETLANKTDYIKPQDNHWAAQSEDDQIPF